MNSSKPSRDVLERNEEVFSRHKADIGCCNFVEHEIELEGKRGTTQGGGEAHDPHTNRTRVEKRSRRY